MISPLKEDGDFDNRQYFQDFLVAFAGLAARMVQIDCQTISECAEDANVTPDLGSHRYIRCILWMAMPNQLPLWKLLHETYAYDFKPTTTAIFERFLQSPSDGIKNLSRFEKGILERTQNVPSLHQQLWTPLNIINKLMQYYLSLQESNRELEDDLRLYLSPSSILHTLPSEAYDLFQAMDSMLQNFVSKQVSALSLELSKGLVNELSLLLRFAATADEHLAGRLLLEHRVIVPDLSKDDCPIMVEMAWKFQLLKKCIMEGRMEIRVQGVESMQQELVGIYTNYIQRAKSTKDHPIAQYLADFVLANKLVEYIVGIDSHPQLINRSGNIAGFLVITSRYTEAESDAIWKTVAASQDSRVIDAVLHMLTNIFNISLYSTLLYLATKLNELPLHMFDTRMMQYGKSLLDYLRRKRNDDRKIDMPPYHLCIRLIRQAAADETLPLHRKRDIQQFATNELQQLLLYGPSGADRKIIYEECIKDIDRRTRFATGSISAINAFLGQNPETGIRSLAAGFDLTPLVIGEFVHVIQNETSIPSTSQIHDEGLVARLTLLQQIITIIPDTITPEIGQQLWEIMVGPMALNGRARDAAWTTLVRATHSSHARNPFIDRCIAEYLPQLNPMLFTAGTLGFVKQATSYEARLNAIPGEGGRLDDDTLAAELLWHLCLVAPAETIEVKAINLLVGLYLDASNTNQAPSSAVEETHIELVQRCIRQLTTAASALRAFSDGNSSGEDESMIIVVSEEEAHSKRLCFTRSLLILKEFVQGIKSRPLYSPPSQDKISSPLNVQDLKGEPICIRYQSFNGGTATGINAIDAGDLETAEDLSYRLVKLTGFSKFTTIANGQKLDLASCSSSTLRDLNLKGLLIIRRAHDAEPIVGPAPESSLRPVEIEVLKHFHELYELLSMEYPLAHDVSLHLSILWRNAKD